MGGGSRRSRSGARRRFPALRGLLLRRQQRSAPAQHRELRVLRLGRRHRVAQRRGKGHPLGDAQAARQIARHRRLHRIPDEDPRHAGARLHRDALRAGRIHRAGQRGPAGCAARQRLVLRGARHGPAGKGRQNAEIARRGRRPDPERRRDRLERLRGAGAAALQRELRAEALAARGDPRQHGRQAPEGGRRSAHRHGDAGVLLLRGAARQKGLRRLRGLHAEPERRLRFLRAAGKGGHGARRQL